MCWETTDLAQSIWFHYTTLVSSYTMSVSDHVWNAGDNKTLCSLSHPSLVAYYCTVYTFVHFNLYISIGIRSHALLKCWDSCLHMYHKYLMVGLPLCKVWAHVFENLGHGLWERLPYSGKCWHGMNIGRLAIPEKLPNIKRFKPFSSLTLPGSFLPTTASLIAC